MLLLLLLCDKCLVDGENVEVSHVQIVVEVVHPLSHTRGSRLKQVIQIVVEVIHPLLHIRGSRLKQVIKTVER